MARRPVALDLFCGEGGASMGLHLAGFDVVGVDIEPKPRYPFPFVQADAIFPPFDLRRFDFIWASLMCERFSRVWRGQPERRGDYPDYIGPTREMLAPLGVPCVLENVIGSPLRPDLVLTGAMFGLPIVRDRRPRIRNTSAAPLSSIWRPPMADKRPDIVIQRIVAEVTAETLGSVIGDIGSAELRGKIAMCVAMRSARAISEQVWRHEI